MSSLFFERRDDGGKGEVLTLTVTLTLVREVGLQFDLSGPPLLNDKLRL